MNKQPGFTLVELLVALAVFLLVIAAFSALLKTCQKSVRAADLLAKDTYLLQSQMEEIRLTAFPQLASLNGRSFADNRGKIIVAPLQPGLYMIELRIDRENGNKPLVMSTLRGTI